jgi:hypothetical protein
LRTYVPRAFRVPGIGDGRTRRCRARRPGGGRDVRTSPDIGRSCEHGVLAEREEGREEGRAEGLKDLIPEVLSVRGLTPTENERAKIPAETDVARVTRWRERVRSCLSIRALLDT